MKRGLIFLCCFFLFSLSLHSELPHSPQNLVATLNSSYSRSVMLSWVRPFDGNSPVLYYVVELSENSKSNTSELHVVLNYSSRLTSHQSCYKMLLQFAKREPALHKGVLRSALCALQEWNDNED